MTTSELSASPSLIGQSTSEVAHGVHVRCQEDRPYVTALCGEVLDWDDEVPATVDMCVVCRDLKQCPICGWRMGVFA